MLALGALPLAAAGPILPLILPLGVPRPSLTQPSPAQISPQLASRVIALPTEPSPGASGPREVMDGHHLRWDGEDPDRGLPGLGPAVPTRTLISVIEQRIDQGGGREASLSVENLGSVLLIRGGAGSSAEALDRAAATAQAAAAEYRGLARSLSFHTQVKLTARGEGVDDRDVILERREIAAGSRTAFGTRTTRRFVADFDVEVASGQAIADPIIALAETGETLHLWASTTLDQEGSRHLYVQGLIDIAIEAPARKFDPNVYELGEVEQPNLTTYQVMFAGSVPHGAPLVVTLEGIKGEYPKRQLEITAEALGGADAAAETLRVVDLSRGMWRGSLNQQHALTDPSVRWEIPESRMPASAAQLMALALGRERLPRPDLGSSALFLVGDAAEGGDARFPAVQSLFESVDPTGPATSITVRSESGDFAATLPATLGALVRVARTQETLFVLDYNPQVANEATLSDPESEIFLTGQVLEGILESSDGVLALRGHATQRELAALHVRDADPIDVGRIQQPVVTHASSGFLAIGGQLSSTAGMTVQLSQAPR